MFELLCSHIINLMKDNCIVIMFVSEIDYVEVNEKIIIVYIVDGCFIVLMVISELVVKLF